MYIDHIGKLKSNIHTEYVYTKYNFQYAFILVVCSYYIHTYGGVSVQREKLWGNYDPKTPEKEDKTVLL